MWNHLTLTLLGNLRFDFFECTFRLSVTSHLILYLMVVCLSSHTHVRSKRKEPIQLWLSWQVICALQAAEHLHSTFAVFPLCGMWKAFKLRHVYLTNPTYGMLVTSSWMLHTSGDFAFETDPNNSRLCDKRNSSVERLNISNKPDLCNSLYSIVLEHNVKYLGRIAIHS